MTYIVNFKFIKYERILFYLRAARKNLKQFYPFQPLYYGAARLTFGQNPESVSTTTTTTTPATTITTTIPTDDTSEEISSLSSETVSNNGAKRSGKGPKVF